MLQSLLSIPYPMYLTGSRYFGGWTIESDWDYFTQNCLETRDWLINHGFKLLRETAYQDTHTVAVYRWTSMGLTIDVQLVRDVTKKLEVSRMLLESGIFLYLKDKTSRTKLWNLLLK